jgi:hypothetical protein
LIRFPEKRVLWIVFEKYPSRAPGVGWKETDSNANTERLTD